MALTNKEVRTTMTLILYEHTKEVFGEFADHDGASSLDCMTALKSCVGLVLNDMATHHELTLERMYDAFVDDLRKGLFDK